jgi:hypothetical protein
VILDLLQKPVNLEQILRVLLYIRLQKSIRSSHFKGIKLIYSVQEYASLFLVSVIILSIGREMKTISMDNFAKIRIIFGRNI